MVKLIEMHYPPFVIEMHSEVLEPIIARLKEKIIRRGDLPHVSIEEQLNYIDQLLEFPLGRALLEKGSIDTYWTDFILSQSGQRRLSNLEDFIVHRSPFVQAWRELARKFKEIIQGNLYGGIVAASIPCGAMKEFLELDYSSVLDFTLIGIDVDLDSLKLAKAEAEKNGLFSHVKLCQQDAWQLPYRAELDLISSCGLNIYVSDSEKVLNLYRQFFKALKPGGKLLMGFLTYPPEESQESEWKVNEMSAKDLILERVIFKDILELQCRNFRTSKECENELRAAGFSKVIFYYDKFHVFPAVVAVK